MTQKELYEKFCAKNYVQIYSKAWWLDAVAGAEHWDVWVDNLDGELYAAMPYYRETRGTWNYITKAPFTQTNGVIIAYPDGQKLPAQQAYAEKVLNRAIDFIEGIGLDVYEQQFPYSFTLWLPFFWRQFTALVRYTYVIEDTSDMERVAEGYAPNLRKNIRKGEKNIASIESIEPDLFYDEHLKIFEKQGLPCNLSRPLWNSMHDACIAHGCGRILAALDAEKNVLSLMFVIWDERAMYPILGGVMPEYSSLQTYPALTHYAIALAGEKGLAFDFEGSMLRRINHAFREYGAQPKQYFRIRKIFNPDIIRKEAEQQIAALAPQPQEG